MNKQAMMQILHDLVLSRRLSQTEQHAIREVLRYLDCVVPLGFAYTINPEFSLADNYAHAYDAFFDSMIERKIISEDSEMGRIRFYLTAFDPEQYNKIEVL